MKFLLLILSFSMVSCTTIICTADNDSQQDCYIGKETDVTAETDIQQGDESGAEATN